MAEYRIRGGRPVRGVFNVHGAKNASLPIMAATILTGGETLLKGCPDISDAGAMKEILTVLGCRVEDSGEGLLIDSSSLSCCEIPDDLMVRMRSSIFLVGALLARCGRVVISQPGGCSIGARPIDLHIKALRRMGAGIEREDGRLVFSAGRLKGAFVPLDFPSVGATENVMLAAVTAEGETRISGCAREPEIRDLQDFLNSCGARVRGAGTSRIIIQGVERLHGCSYGVMGDRIEAGTYLMAAAGTGGELEVRGIGAEHLRSCLKFLKFAGCTVKNLENGVYLSGPERLYGTGKVSTGPYPAFPTDLQPQFVSLMTVARGKTQMTEKIFENRFGYTKQLIKMGADIEIFRRIAIIKGNEFLTGNCVAAEDLRGGAALVIAGLMACGETVVKDIEFVERGYCRLHEELASLGADIDRCL